MPEHAASCDLFPYKTQTEVVQFILMLETSQILRYIEEIKQWVLYKEGYWKPMDSGITHRIYNQFWLPRLLSVEFPAAEAASARQFRKALGGISYIEALSRELSRRTPLLSHIKDYDQHPYLINFRNGTYDLQTNTLRPASSGDRLLTQIPYNYIPDTPCPRFQTFLARILPPGIIKYLQTFFGICLSGEVLQSVHIFWGTGKNGKSVLCKLMSQLLSNYAVQMPSQTLIKYKNGPGAQPEITRLRGTRLALAGEISEGQLNETAIKKLVSHDPIVARKLYEDYIEFMPTHKLIISGNTEPHIAGTDLGIWRRVKKVPFTEIITDEEEIELDTLVASIMTEASGILNWMVDGWKRYQVEGLVEPESIQLSTSEYQENEDSLGEFITETLDKAPGKEISSSLILEMFNNWMVSHGYQKWNSKTFSSRMLHKRYTRHRKTQGFFWNGLSPRSEALRIETVAI